MFKIRYRPENKIEPMLNETEMLKISLLKQTSYIVKNMPRLQADT